MRTFFGKALAILFGVLFAFFLVEVLGRVLPASLLPGPFNILIQEMAVGTRRYSRPHDDLKYTIKPGTDFELKQPEFVFRYKTNLNFPDAGFRGGTLGGPVWGVAVGDSFTFGSGVNQEATWVAQLAALAKKDVLNLGVPGYGPFQYTRALEKYGGSLSPRIIFYVLYANDLADSIAFQQWLNGRQRKMSHKTYLRRNFITIHLFNKLRGWRKSKKRSVEVPDVDVKLVPRRLSDPYGLGKNSYDSAWTLAKRQIEKAHEDSKRINAAFVLLYLPSKEEVYWDQVKAKARRVASAEERSDRLNIDLSEFCSARGLWCLDLSQALRARASKAEKLYFTINIHWTENTHRVAAEEIHRFLTGAKIL
jgi:hypothetical protein